jgi:protein-S-isoprenylcysteine O-methyltransferase Ste14
MGTSAGLLAVPAGVQPIAPATVCMAIIIAGLLLQVGAKMTLGLSFGVVAANRGVKVLGPYRLVRHPIYAGYTIAHIGGLLAMPSLTNAWLYGAALVLQIARIFCEERVLKEDIEYRAYAAHVHYRLVPGIF